MIHIIAQYVISYLRENVFKLNQIEMIRIPKMYKCDILNHNGYKISIMQFQQ